MESWLSEYGCATVMSNQIQSENIFFFKITAGCDGA